MVAIEAKKVSKDYGYGNVLENISFQLNEGDTLGIVGSNGCGKTTLFKIFTNKEDASSGNIYINKNMTIGYLAQEPKENISLTVKDVIMDAFFELNNIKENIKKIEEEMCKDSSKLMDKYLELINIYEIKGGYKIEEKFNKICNGFKFSNEFLFKYYSKLSGGEKTKVNLAKILLKEPDILMLDEPTNHLDIEMLEWLEEYIKRYKGTILIISHDRYFMDRVVNKILEIDNGVSKIYNGNYSYYIEEKDRIFRDMVEQYKRQNNKIKKMEEAIARYKVWGQKNDIFHKKVKDMQKKIDRIEKLDKPKSKNLMKLNIENNSRSGNDVIYISNLIKKFKKQELFYIDKLELKFRDRMVLIGSNGSGKTTLIKMIMKQFNDKKIQINDDYNIDEGIIKIGKSIKVGYLEQVINFNDENMSILEYMNYKLGISNSESRKELAKFLFFDNDIDKKIGTLSGGEKARLLLCELTYNEVNLLILDEPTNHLDLDSINILEAVLSEYMGTMLIISHDRYFINKIGNKIVELKNRNVIVYNGNYDYYVNEKKKMCLVHNKINNINKNAKLTQDKKNYQKSKEQRAKEKRKKNIEKAILDIEDKIINLDKKMYECGDNLCKLNELTKEKEKLNNDIDKKYNELIELESELI